MNKFKAVINAMEDWVSGILVFLGIMFIFIGVVMRYLFNSPISWADEISRYLIIWGTFIGATVALRDNHHIRVELLYNVFPKPVRRIVNIFASCVGLAFSLFLIIYGSKLVQSRYATGQVSTDMGFSLWLVYLILPIAGTLLGIRYLQRFILVVMGKPESNHDVEMEQIYETMRLEKEEKKLQRQGGGTR